MSPFLKPQDLAHLREMKEAKNALGHRLYSSYEVMAHAKRLEEYGVEEAICAVQDENVREILAYLLKRIRGT